MKNDGEVDDNDKTPSINIASTTDTTHNIPKVAFSLAKTNSYMNSSQNDVQGVATSQYNTSKINETSLHLYKKANVCNKNR